MMRLVVFLVLAVGCTDAKTIVDPDATALQIVVDVPANLGVDSLRISATGRTPAFAPGTVPETPRPLAGEQTAVVLLPDTLDGTEVVIRVDGLAGATVVASGGTRTTVRAGELGRVDVTLGGPATCGDAAVADPIEACDDGDIEVADGCAADCTVEDGYICTAPVGGPSSCRLDTFDVTSVASSGNREMVVTFSDPPDPIAALVLDNYTAPGLTLSGTPFLAGNTVTIATSPQVGINYNVVVATVTRAKDTKPLTTTVGGFLGRTPFDVVSARSTSATQIAVTFSEAPDPTTASVLANYNVPGITLTGTPVVAGATVTITTSLQTSITYTATTSGVLRASDTEPLTVTTASFTGVNGFDLTTAVATSNRQLVLKFNAPPNVAQASVLANYTVPQLTLVGSPIVEGSTVTLETVSQAVVAYEITVQNVTRASDGQVLTIASATFTGEPIRNPTVTDVTVLATVPNNGTTFFNTGTATVRLTGTQFATVTCPTGVRVAALDGVDAAANAVATSCTVDSDTQITATFPAGIRTNGDTGWTVIVTNSVGSNANSDTLVVRAGLLISEVFVGNGNHNFLELYNPTATSLNINTLALRFHVRNAMGVDNQKSLTLINSVVPSHGFYLISSSMSDSGDPWFAKRDATYNAAGTGIVANGGVYISLKNAANDQVLDKVGYGTQPAGGFEGTRLADIPVGQSVERKPAGGAGHAVDTDVNASDFNAASATITPRGTTDAAQP